jgi:hypothetical protein
MVDQLGKCWSAMNGVPAVAEIMECKPSSAAIACGNESCPSLYLNKSNPSAWHYDSGCCGLSSTTVSTFGSAAQTFSPPWCGRSAPAVDQCHPMTAPNAIALGP